MVFGTGCVSDSARSRVLLGGWQGEACLTSASAVFPTPCGEGPHSPLGGMQDESYPEIRQVAADGERLEDPTVTGLENLVTVN